MMSWTDSSARLCTSLATLFLKFIRTPCIPEMHPGCTAVDYFQQRSDSW